VLDRWIGQCALAAPRMDSVASTDLRSRISAGDDVRNVVRPRLSFLCHPEEGQHCEDDNNQADEIDDRVHDKPPISPVSGAVTEQVNAPLRVPFHRIERLRSASKLKWMEHQKRATLSDPAQPGRTARRSAQHPHANPQQRKSLAIVPAIGSPGAPNRSNLDMAADGIEKRERDVRLWAGRKYGLGYP